MRLLTQARTLTSTLARRGAWLIVMVALVAVLALSACAGRGGAPGNTGTGGSGGTGQVSGGSTVSVEVDNIAQTDADLNAIFSALDSANTDANIDLSGQDNPVQP